MTRFERELYADPDADLGTIWWDLVERHQLVDRPDGDRPDDWATKIHIALAPVYYQNYLLGEITASQLEATLERETGHANPAGAPAEAGRLLRERFMRPGASVRWDELVEQTTGRPLSPDDFARQLGAA
jgi:peptidyl-dipeptidase A